MKYEEKTTFKKPSLVRVKTYQKLPVEINLESLNEKIKQKVSAYTADRITENTRPINWKKCKDKWKHLKNINFQNRYGLFRITFFNK